LARHLRLPAGQRASDGAGQTGRKNTTEYRTLGRTGARVSALCLGAWMFGDRVDAAESERILDEARGAGINFVDTANVYAGQRSEEILGNWFATRLPRS
jgi:aryl-alcohol dehydrogenase-like predicted oxidoreductase